MKRTMGFISVLAVAAVVGAPLAKAAYSYAYAYIQHIEGDVEIQRASEPEPDRADINLPVLSGDRVWTRGGARAEIDYGDGSLLRMDEHTRVDFVDFGERGGELLLRQWSGSTILRLTEERAKRFRLDTPAGTVYPASAGLYRTDVVDGGQSVVVSAYEGVAELASEGGSVLIRSGQRSAVETGRRPEPSFPFNTARTDDFLSWSDDRDSLYARTERIEGVPREVDVYVDELSAHGRWRIDVELGPVWYPAVSVGWYPYSYGRWVYTWYGWTWVSYEPWGWAPYHYGRWGYNDFGWYWIPGAYWGPAWVSWAIGPGWIGWCPLGYYDRPVHRWDHIWYRDGKAVPRGSLARRTRGEGWTFVRRGDFATRRLSAARLRTAEIRGTARNAHILESGAVLDRSLRPRVVGAAAMTRLPKRGLSELNASSRRGDGTVRPGAVGRRGGLDTRSSGALRRGGVRDRVSSEGNRLPSSSSRDAASSPLRRAGPQSSSSSRGRRGETTGLGQRRGPTNDVSGRSEGGHLRRGAIPRRSTTTREGRAEDLERGAPLENRSVRGRSESSRRGRSIGSVRSPSRVRDRTSIGSSRQRDRSTLSGRSPTERAPRTPRRPTLRERTNRSPSSRAPRGLSSSRERSRTLRSSPSRSRSLATPRRSSPSSRGRDFFDRMTRSRPTLRAPRSRSGGAPKVRAPRSRSPRASSPSRSGGSSAASRSRSRGTRKKNKD